MTSTNPTMREQLALDIGAATEREGYLALVRVDAAGAAHSPPLSFGRVGATVAVVELVGYIAGLEDELAESRAAHGRELETSINLKNRLAASVLACDAYRDEVDSLRSSVTLAGAALGVTSDGPAEFVRLARLAADSVVMHTSAIARIREALSRGRSPHAVEALRVLDEDLARSRGAR